MPFLIISHTWYYTVREYIEPCMINIREGGIYDLFVLIREHNSIVVALQNILGNFFMLIVINHFSPVI
jgi:hypothetical protein